MCGIFGIVTSQEQILGPILVEAGRKLTYRGMIQSAVPP